ncbi:MAG: hypothetical protein GY719_32540 [bacterium]|nr:hypothetical protein [bacterium]
MKPGTANDPRRSRHLRALLIIVSILGWLSPSPGAGLGLLETHTDIPLAGATEIAFGPGGEHLYVASSDDEAVVTLRRNSSGSLDFVDADTVDDLSIGRSVAVSSEDRLCLGGGRFAGRFEIELAWRDFQGVTGEGHPVPGGTPDSGLLWFFQPDNWEMLIKVLDGCDINDRVWVFAATASDVEYTLRVTDVLSGEAKEYHNPLGRAAPAITDTGAFSVCPTD